MYVVVVQQKKLVHFHSKIKQKSAILNLVMEVSNIHTKPSHHELTSTELKDTFLAPISSDILHTVTLSRCQCTRPSLWSRTQTFLVHPVRWIMYITVDSFNIWVLVHADTENTRSTRTCCGTCSRSCKRCWAEVRNKVFFCQNVNFWGKCTTSLLFQSTFTTL